MRYVVLAILALFGIVACVAMWEAVKDNRADLRAESWREGL